MGARKYTADHEWVVVDGDIGTVGITDYAQKALGDVVYVEVPAVGTSLAKKDQLGAVESVKAASDIYAPVSGEVIEANDVLANEPSLINSSPLEKGWIAKIKLSNPEELKTLLDDQAYAALTDE
ncbi:glycine cleavage system H protein [Blyttiomyces helicus]|uniref:Glycine cleavage system H protein n=1 Tax=Blyttiomyces helicus TaxID=388810 RepID=A0A4V1IS36_9FUNG|nr:glycine cleavage system H protein [Blyttiomyces helicus]|eukprot:RKO92187.1 glycine cleavage system H protein [Blyttiomyces helicus]